MRSPVLAVTAVALLSVVLGASAAKPSFRFKATAPAHVATGTTALDVRVQSSSAAAVTATLYRADRQLHAWNFSVAPGVGRRRLALRARERTPGGYNLLLAATAEGKTVFQTLHFRIG